MLKEETVNGNKDRYCHAIIRKARGKEESKMFVLITIQYLNNNSS